MKLLLSLLFGVLCIVPSASAQSTPDIVYWPAATLKGYSPTLKERITNNKTMSASEILKDLGNYKFEILRRDGEERVDGDHDACLLGRDSWRQAGALDDRLDRRDLTSGEKK